MLPVAVFSYSLLIHCLLGFSFGAVLFWYLLYSTSADRDLHNANKKKIYLLFYVLIFQCFLFGLVIQKIHNVRASVENFSDVSWMGVCFIFGLIFFIFFL